MALRAKLNHKVGICLGFNCFHIFLVQQLSDIDYPEKYFYVLQQSAVEIEGGIWGYIYHNISYAMYPDHLTGKRNKTALPFHF